MGRWCGMAFAEMGEQMERGGKKKKRLLERNWSQLIRAPFREKGRPERKKAILITTHPRKEDDVGNAS